jgi:hypothetical protein
MRSDTMRPAPPAARRLQGHIYYRGVVDRVTAIAAQSHSNMLVHMWKALAPEAPKGTEVLVGHDGGESQQLVIESPWSLFTSNSQRC